MLYLLVSELNSRGTLGPFSRSTIVCGTKCNSGFNDSCGTALASHKLWLFAFLWDDGRLRARRLGSRPFWDRCLRRPTLEGLDGE